MIAPAPDYILPLADVLRWCRLAINGARPLVKEWAAIGLQLEYAIGELPPGWIPGEPLGGRKVTTQVKQAEEVREKEVAAEEKRAKEVEEARLKEPVKAKLIRLLAGLRVAAGGSVKKDLMQELETTVVGLKTEELVGDSDYEKKVKEEREKAEKERKAAEAKEEKEAAREAHAAR